MFMNRVPTGKCGHVSHIMMMEGDDTVIATEVWFRPRRNSSIEQVYAFYVHYIWI